MSESSRCRSWWTESRVGTPQTVAPYFVSWDSTTVANGAHGISARAVDAAGRSTMSAVVNVTVTNPPQVIDFNALIGNRRDP